MFLNVEDVLYWHYRDAPEATGDEPDDADFEMPKIYEPVSNDMWFIELHLTTNYGDISW